MTAEEAFEEICCDALGDMNIFSDDGREILARYGESLTKAKKSAERQANQGRAPPRETGVKYSYEGKNKDGIEIYETSDEVMNLSISERNKRFLQIMKEQYKGRTAKFVRNGHAYYATFELADVNKNIYGDNRSDAKGQKAKVRTGADGNIFELVENSRYSGSKAESGKSSKAHKGVGYWDYFIKTVQIDNAVYDLVANVRKTRDNQYVYGIQLRENKKIKASPAVGSQNVSFSSAANTLENSIPTTSENVKNKYSLEPEEANIAESAKYLQSIGRKSINDFTEDEIKNTKPFAEKYWREMGTKSPFFRAWFGDWRVNDASRVQIATRKDSKRGVQRNDDTGWDINVSGKIFNETRAHTANYNREAVSYLPYINDIVKKAVLLDSYSLGTVKSPNSLLMHSMYAVADIGDGPTFLKLYVEEMNDPNKANTAKRAYQLQNIEKYQQPDAKGSGKFPSPVIQTADVSTISDLFKVVKAFDKNFNPKPASKVVNEDGTPMKVYHGTSDVFWEFKNSELSPNEDSFFFAQNRDDAAAYTGNGRIMSAYVNLQNPVDYNDMPSEIYKLRNKKAQVEALKKLGYDGWMADMETGWGEVSAFYPEQIKSATDNIGTFDASNPDIRYSLESKKLTELRRENERKLAEATEADATNENERGLIKNYKQQYNKVLDIAVKLDAAKQELSKAEADGATNDAIQAQNRVTILNRQYAREHRKLNGYKETKALQKLHTRSVYHRSQSDIISKIYHP